MERQPQQQQQQQRKVTQSWLQKSSQQTIHSSLGWKKRLGLRMHEGVFVGIGIEGSTVSRHSALRERRSFDMCVVMSTVGFKSDPYAFRCDTNTFHCFCCLASQITIPHRPSL